MNQNETQKRMRVEVAIASPPTQKCRATVALMEEMTRQFPDTVRLDVYIWGQMPPKTATMRYCMLRKVCRVPSVLINGRIVSNDAIPDAETVESAIRSELAKGPEGWVE